MAQASASIIETSLLLCEVIESWQSSDRRGEIDGRLDWDEITSKMVERTGKPVLRSDLQTVWKYIAYGKRRVRDGEGENVTYSDDEEPFYQPFSAVKRHKVHASAQLQQKSEVTKKGVAQAAVAQPSTGQHVLASTVVDAMKTDVLCKQIQITIPEHVRLGNAGIQPPLYVPSSEMALVTSKLGKNQPRAHRNPRVARLAAQGNDALSAALQPAQPAMVLSTVVRPQGGAQTSQGGYVPGRGSVASAAVPSAGAQRPVPTAAAPVKPPGAAPSSTHVAGAGKGPAPGAANARPVSAVSTRVAGGPVTASAAGQQRPTGSTATAVAGRLIPTPVGAPVVRPAAAGVAVAGAVFPPVVSGHQIHAPAPHGTPVPYPGAHPSGAAGMPAVLPVPGVGAGAGAGVGFPPVPFPVLRLPPGFVLPPHLAAMYTGLAVPMGAIVGPPLPPVDGTGGGHGAYNAAVVTSSVDGGSSGTGTGSTSDSRPGPSNVVTEQS